MVVGNGSRRGDAEVLVVHDVSGCGKDNKQSTLGKRRMRMANGGALSSGVGRVIGERTAQQQGHREPGQTREGLQDREASGSVREVK